MAINSEYAVKILENISKLGEQFEKVALVSKDGQRVYVLKVILAVVGKFFARLDATEIVVDDLDGALLNDLVTYFYSGNIELNFENLKHYMDVADKFRIELLREKCLELQNARVTFAKCVDCFIFADGNNLGPLRQRAFQVICEGFGDIPSLEMRKLNFEQFGEVLEADELSAAEETIFERLVDWVDADEMDRAKHVPDLMEHIRLKHITHKVLIEKVDVFCVKHNLHSFTKDEYHKRLLNPLPISHYRSKGNKRVFITFRDHQGNFQIKVHNADTMALRENITTIPPPIPSNSKQFSPTNVLCCPDKFFFFRRKRIEMLDLVSNTRETITTMDDDRSDFTPLMVDQFIYILGGTNNYYPGALKGCSRFNTTLKLWQSLQPMHVARRSYAVAAVKGLIFVAGGADSNAQASIERYDPTKNEWMKVASIKWGVVYNLIEWKDHLYAVGSKRNVERYDMERNEWERPDIAEMGDGIMSSIQSLAHNLPRSNFQIDQWQIFVRDKDYFKHYRYDYQSANGMPMMNMNNFTWTN